MANQFNIQGLTEEQVAAARINFGSNTIQFKKENGILNVVKSLAKEPMVLLLLVASLIYFMSGKISDGIFLTAAIVLISFISLYQEKRSHNALKKLQQFTQPQCKVVRNGVEQVIKTDELVVGDYLIVSEGDSIIADGIIVQSNDFSVNESVLTGESLSVFKDKDQPDNNVFSGTAVASGLALVQVTNIGNTTRWGKIGLSLLTIAEEKTPLELQIDRFVKNMVIIGVIVFVLVWMINYIHTKSFINSLLNALTLAMSILPEEIPVAFTTFMALGAWRLMNNGIIVKQMKTVETLGSATVLCTDKTGTLTQNKMSLAKVYIFSEKSIVPVQGILSSATQELLTVAMWASEPVPFDPMETALHHAYSYFTLRNERLFYKLVHEYPLGGKPPMMTHIFERVSGERIIAAKGAPEALMAVSNLSSGEREGIENAIKELAASGYRVLGVGQSYWLGNDFPDTQQEFPFTFKGLVAFYDPPKENIAKVLKDFYNAGIAVKIITGDNALTTAAIAKEIGFRGYEKNISGDELMQLSDDRLQTVVMETNVFSRMFPEAKLKIVTALKKNNQIVAMTGDGVNDGPALKAAHIGIAMGKNGTTIAKDAASLILTEDDLAKMVDAVAMGRKIYTNLKKAIQYIISIHIPIILTVFIPLALGWVYPDIFTPLHVIVLELIMGPTCSVIYENEPMEANAMTKKPRPFTATFFSSKELTTSIIQGLVITIGVLGMYQWAVNQGYDEDSTRTMVFTTLMIANVVLTEVNRSFYYSVITTARYKNPMVLYIISSTIGLLLLLLFVPYLSTLFKFKMLNVNQFMLCVAAGSLSVLWYEVVKFIKRQLKG
jgi:Ca2+-transporting ATPase